MYWDPMKLIITEDKIFLETEYDDTGKDGIRCWLKDSNGNKNRKIWRYHHYDSGLPFYMKKAGIMMCLKKVHHMANDDQARITTGLHRLKEFMDLGYPIKLLQHLCAIMARDTGDRAWIQVRDLLYETHYRPKAGIEEKGNLILTIQNCDGSNTG